MKQINFFALAEDLLQVLEIVEDGGPLKYVPMGQSPTEDCQEFSLGAQIPGLGKANTDSASSCQAYLVVDSETPTNLRPIIVAGVTRYAVDQLLNPKTVTFTPAGLWGENVVLNGRVATVSDSVEAQQLMKRFSSAFKKRFRKVRAFLVGPGAYALLTEGKRLTAAVQSPREYDLQF
jgi:hypothetical protein